MSLRSVESTLLMHMLYTRELAYVWGVYTIKGDTLKNAVIIKGRFQGLFVLHWIIRKIINVSKKERPLRSLKRSKTYISGAGICLELKKMNLQELIFYCSKHCEEMS